MTNLGCETLEDAIEVIGDKLVQEFALELAEHGWIYCRDHGTLTVIGRLRVAGEEYRYRRKYPSRASRNAPVMSIFVGTTNPSTDRDFLHMLRCLAERRSISCCKNKP